MTIHRFLTAILVSLFFVSCDYTDLEDKIITLEIENTTASSVTLTLLSESAATETEEIILDAENSVTRRVKSGFTLAIKQETQTGTDSSIVPIYIRRVEESKCEIREYESTVVTVNNGTGSDVLLKTDSTYKDRNVGFSSTTIQAGRTPVTLTIYAYDPSIITAEYADTSGTTRPSPSKMAIGENYDIIILYDNTNGASNSTTETTSETGA